jgi:serine/threonine-protein kinase
MSGERELPFASTTVREAGKPASDRPETLDTLPGPPPRMTVLPTASSAGNGRAAVGSMAGRRYVEVRELGAGGMGVVDLCVDNDIGREVAIKRLHQQDGGSVARFVEEVRTVGRLEHPNIVPIHDVGLDERGRYFFVMKHVAGETLEQIIDKLRAGDADYEARFPVERRVEIFQSVLHALGYAHARGILHRDIRPANVMVGRHGEVMLMDWGIAKPLGAAEVVPADEASAGGADAGGGRPFRTTAGSLVGTPAYMSPEQARGEVDALDARSDLYSAAVLFHELVFLRHYLDGRETLHAVLEAISGEQFDFVRLGGLRHPRAVVAPELVHFVARALQKDRDARFASTDDMLAELERMQAGLVRVQCHATFAKRFTRELGRLIDRRPHLGSLLVTGSALLVVAAAIIVVARLL